MVTCRACAIVVGMARGRPCLKTGVVPRQDVITWGMHADATLLRLKAR